MSGLKSIALTTRSIAIALIVYVVGLVIFLGVCLYLTLKGSS